MTRISLKKKHSITIVNASVTTSTNKSVVNTLTNNPVNPPLLPSYPTIIIDKLSNDISVYYFDLYNEGDPEVTEWYINDRVHLDKTNNITRKHVAKFISYINIIKLANKHVHENIIISELPKKCIKLSENILSKFNNDSITRIDATTYFIGKNIIGKLLDFDKINTSIDNYLIK